MRADRRDHLCLSLSQILTRENAGVDPVRVQDHAPARGNRLVHILPFLELLRLSLRNAHALIRHFIMKRLLKNRLKRLLLCPQPQRHRLIRQNHKPQNPIQRIMRDRSRHHAERARRAAQNPRRAGVGMAQHVIIEHARIHMYVKFKIHCDLHSETMPFFTLLDYNIPNKRSSAKTACQKAKRSIKEALSAPLPDPVLPPDKCCPYAFPPFQI